MKYLLLFFLSILTSSSFSQTDESSMLKLKYSNNLGSGIMAHTISVKLDANGTNDVESQPGFPSYIEIILNRLEEIEGVKRATFDGATSTITVVSNEKVNLTEAIQEFNKTEAK